MGQFSPTGHAFGEGLCGGREEVPEVLGLVGLGPIIEGPIQGRGWARDIGEAPLADLPDGFLEGASGEIGAEHAAGRGGGAHKGGVL